MKILVCNVGSTSLKFKLYDMPACTVLSQGKAERVGSLDDAIFQYENLQTGSLVNEEKTAIPDYKAGIRRYLDCLTDPQTGVLSSVSQIERVGYKTTLSKNHFGDHELTDEVIEGMRAWLPLATLHNTGYLQAIGVMREALPDAIFLGCFETGFHRDIPLERRLYGVPYEWYERYGVQRLGYHSASHGYIADVLGKISGGSYRAISCHLGGSSSVCAIQDGKSVDTSFGMSLQSGLIHAARVGDMDCDLYEFLRHEGLSDAQIHEGFEKKAAFWASRASAAICAISRLPPKKATKEQGWPSKCSSAALCIISVRSIWIWAGWITLSLPRASAKIQISCVGVSAKSLAYWALCWITQRTKRATVRCWS